MKKRQKNKMHAVAIQKMNILKKIIQKMKTVIFSTAAKETIKKIKKIKFFRILR